MSTSDTPEACHLVIVNGMMQTAMATRQVITAPCAFCSSFTSQESADSSFRALQIWTHVSVFALQVKAPCRR